jgi:hypothetical protein
LVVAAEEMQTKAHKVDPLEVQLMVTEAIPQQLDLR